MFSEIIDQMSQVAGIPLFAVFLISILFIKPKYYFFYALVFAGLYAVSLYHGHSSRYYSAFVIISFLLWIVIQKNHVFRTKPVLPFLLFLIIFGFETSKDLRASSNNYYYCLFDTVSKINRQAEDSPIFINELESARFIFFKEIRSISYPKNDLSFLQKLISEYYFYGVPTYCLIDCPKKELSNLDKILSASRIQYSTIANCTFGKNNSKNYSILKLDTTNSVYAGIDSTIFDPKDSLIENGDMEISAPNTTVRNLTKKWIDEGAVFYTNNDVVLPRFRILLNTATQYPDKNFPIFFLDNTDPINGKYSLHADLKQVLAVPIYLLNTIPSQSMVLTFKIKSLSDKMFFELFKYDYKNNEKVQSEKINYFYLKDNLTHEYYVYYDNSDFSGDSTLFILRSSESEFLLDDVACYPSDKSSF